MGPRATPGPAAPTNDAVATGSVSVNTLPAPGVLSAVRSPPMPRARSRLMARPSPTPSCGRVCRWSTCTNGSKIVASFSGAIPIPVSRTATVT